MAQVIQSSCRRLFLKRAQLKGNHRYHAPKDTRGSTDAEGAAFGFIDGDFLEHFPGLTQDVRQKIMDGKSAPEKLKMSEYDFLKTLEQLQGLH